MKQIKHFETNIKQIKFFGRWEPDFKVCQCKAIFKLSTKGDSDEESGNLFYSSFVGNMFSIPKN